MKLQSSRVLALLIGFAAVPLLALNAPEGCQSMTCEERVEAANDYVASVVADNLDCMTDTDCTAVSPGTDCMGMCPVPVNVDGVEEVQAAVAHANATWCADYIEDGCPYATPSCIAFEPVCVEGICVAQY